LRRSQAGGAKRETHFLIAEDVEGEALPTRTTSDRDTTPTIRAMGDKRDIGARVAQIGAQIEDAISDHDREKLQERLAKRAGGVAVIRVGAPSEAETASRKEAFDDAINAINAAVEKGIVFGGGFAPLRCAEAIKTEDPKSTEGRKTGLEILRHTLSVPTRQIAENSSVDERWL